MKNTLALATLEGFSKWAKAGLKAFVSYDLRHFELPDTEGGVMKYNEHSVSVGGQLSKDRASCCIIMPWPKSVWPARMQEHWRSTATWT